MKDFNDFAFPSSPEELSEEDILVINPLKPNADGTRPLGVVQTVTSYYEGHEIVRIKSRNPCNITVYQTFPYSKVASFPFAQSFSFCERPEAKMRNRIDKKDFQAHSSGTGRITALFKTDYALGLNDPIYIRSKEKLYTYRIDEILDMGDFFEIRISKADSEREVLQIETPYREDLQI